MLIVRVYINDTVVRTGTALRVKGDTKPDSVNTYKLHDGTHVKHRYGDGATKLAKKVLRKVNP